MIKVCLIGTNGRMGQLIVDVLQNTPHALLAAGVVRHMPDKASPLPLTTDVGAAVAASDVIIDFSVADHVAAHAALAAIHGKAFMTGVTGLPPVAIDELRQAAARIPVLYAANTSLSLAVMKAAVRQVSALLAPFDYDVAIHDEHHRMKKDAPSGTAKALGAEVLAGNKGTHEPAYSAIRTGGIVGEHEVVFAGFGETIRLRHSVTDRRVFAQGAVESALWLAQQGPGYYTMDDVIALPAA